MSRRRFCAHIESMAKRIDPQIHNNFIDANVPDRLDDGHDEAVDEMLTLAEQGSITLMLTHSVKTEIGNPNTPSDVKQRTLGLIFTEPVSLTNNELELHKQVREMVQGNAKPGRHDRDAFHVVEAAKYGGGYFVTRDQRLLGKRGELSGLLDIEIVSPSDFIRLYHEFGAADKMPRR